MAEYTPTTEEVRAAASRAIGGDWFDLWLAAHDAEKNRRITELEARVSAHSRISLAAIFLADTFDSDSDPDVEIRKIRDEWLANHDAQVAAEARAVALDVNTRYHCCSHCADDPGYHAENPPDSHDTSCGTWRNPCTTGGDIPADRITGGTSGEQTRPYVPVDAEDCGAEWRPEEGTSA